MLKNRNKIIVLFLTHIFLISGVVTASEINNENGIEKSEEELTPVSLSKTVILYRHGVDGSITPIKVKIDSGNSKDFGDAILDKCQELFENDEEFENISKIKVNIFSIVRSKGRGFHYQMQLLGKLSIRYILFRLGLPRIHTLFMDPLIVCKYKNEEAKTTIRPLILPNIKVEINGSHVVIVHNFIGFTSWIGRFALTPLNLTPRSFYGIARLAFCQG